ncbi:Druantia anti-phage system protein DruA [Mesorhizobium shangrilense]|uniref:Druantia anti-phage system protein DruA n=1 Tax=Mesorhizobium shangrilense TaxID=460060 RepID=A0ABV2DSL3_9HYPH
MIIPLDPNLEGLAEKRFFSVARQISDRQEEGNSRRISAIVETEAARASSLPELNGQTDRYAACIRVLGDLAQLRWALVESGYGLELHSPRPQDESVVTPEQARARKDAIRKELRPRVQQQFEDKSVRAFIRQMERPSVSTKHRSIRTLIADGAELHSRLEASRSHPAGGQARFDALSTAVRPYLQLVEAGVRDEQTGILLQDIWRYFRYTWSIPQTPIPGRKLLYVVRDAAHPSHAVIGIAALSNCAVQMVPRDARIGWSTRGLTVALTALFAPAKRRRELERTDPLLEVQGLYNWLRPSLPTKTDPRNENKIAILKLVQEWLLNGIDEAVGEIEISGLMTEEEVRAPTDAVIDRLRRMSQEFADQRQVALSQGDDDSYDLSLLHDPWSDAPVGDEVLQLEAKHTTNKRVHDSRRMLVRKKRAFELSRLLDAQRVLLAYQGLLCDPARAISALESEDIRTAVNTAMSAAKSRRIGTNILEITTCGAVAPYSHMLGGKLVALMLLSPKIAADYKQRYGSEPTIIRSQLKNEPVSPDSTLVWLGTTSLFSHGSSQYERLRLPAGVISDEQAEIRYSYLGATSGYGTVQFSDETVRSVEVVMRQQRGYRDVNGVFGEGASPRLRKLRSGLDALGFNSGLVLLHHQERRIYGAPLFPGAGSYLCGLTKTVPNYVEHPERFLDASEKIADFWRRRWLAQRIEHDASWEALARSGPWLLSSQLPIQSVDTGSLQSEEVPPNGGTQSPSDGDELSLWRKLAQAGPNAISEGLGDADFARLHLKTKLEDRLLERARQGYSIVLTGNAGDGKTHLARAIQQRLGTDAANFDFAFDATAIMTREDGVRPIVERWRQARHAGKAMILAVNQYPLYRLRQELRRGLPDLSVEIERQWGERVVYGLEQTSMNSSEKLILVDLSLRNPLSVGFAGQALDRMLNSPAIQRYAQSGVDSNFSFNYRHLSNKEVRRRLLALFSRVISAGGRATVRELWILCARLLFGSADEPETAGAERTWYSERLFELDPRFPLTELLRRFADPAGVTHPQLDRKLETPNGTYAGDWQVDGELPEPIPARLAMAGLREQGRDKYRNRFAAIKRRFYFEHVQGGEENVFSLDDSSHGAFHQILSDSVSDALHLQKLIGAINRCYLPTEFEGIREKLFLWVGHRLDEQPTASYVANESIPRSRLRLRRPSPQAGLSDVFDYAPDHLLLGVMSLNGEMSVELSLRIDAELYGTLMSIEQGLPRHLINPGELNRLDSFIDRLRGAAPEQSFEFLIYNAEHVLPAVIQMTPDYARYDAVRRL